MNSLWKNLYCQGGVCNLMTIDQNKQDKYPFSLLNISPFSLLNISPACINRVCFPLIMAWQKCFTEA